MRPGLAWISSVTRITTVSRRPPVEPETRPTVTPITVKTTTATRAPLRVTCPPCSRRLSTSRPSESVPSGWAPEGGLFTAP